MNTHGNTQRWESDARAARAGRQRSKREPTTRPTGRTPSSGWPDHGWQVHQRGHTTRRCPTAADPVHEDLAAEAVRQHTVC